MAIVTIRASKATPVKAMEYITDKGKAAFSSARNLDTSHDLAQQMMTTARLWGKAQGEGDRKYYHLKISFAPEDWIQNGGTLDERGALSFGMRIMREFCPTTESVGSVHVDRQHLHFHGIINAVDIESGKMLDMRDADYRRLKDRVQELCAEKGLNAIDWRRATREKRAREGQAAEPITQTFAEKGLQDRGKTVWKDQLRDIIDQAASSCSNMDDFRNQLQANGVTLTRCTEQTISYKMGDHRACRGDTLGGDYTAEAIRNALAHNRPAEQRLGAQGMDALVGRSERKAAGVRDLKPEERAQVRELGRLAGVKRAEVDELCDVLAAASWDEKQKVWEEYRLAREEFWKEYNIRQERIRREIDAAYRMRQRYRQAEWALDPRNRHKSLFGSVVALIYVMTHDDPLLSQIKTNQLKQQQQQLRQEMVAFKSKTGEAVETLRKKGLSLDEYMETVRQMHDFADRAYERNAELEAGERRSLEREINRQIQSRDPGR